MWLAPEAVSSSNFNKGCWNLNTGAGPLLRVADLRFCVA